MTPKTTAQRQAALKARRKAEGFVRVEVYVKPEHAAKIRALARKLTTGNK